MKQASFITGLIGSILGIISNGIFLFIGFNMKVTEEAGPKVLIFSTLGILLSILALVGSCIRDKKVLTGIFILAGAVANLICVAISTKLEGPLIFIMCAVVAIILLTSGIMRICQKK